MHRRELDELYEQTIAKTKAILWVIGRFWLYVVFPFVIVLACCVIINLNRDDTLLVAARWTLALNSIYWLGLGLRWGKKKLLERMEEKFGFASTLHIWLLFAYEVEIANGHREATVKWCEQNVKSLWDSRSRNVETPGGLKLSHVFYFSSRRTALLVKLKFGGK
jgi:hypothetical protein